MNPQHAKSLADQDTSVLIGRFQPFHNGHLALLRQALNAAPVCVVVISSPLQARSPIHPFTWRERAQMIESSLSTEDRARLRIVPVRDHFAESRWIEAVGRDVDAAMRASGSRLLLGRLKGEMHNDFRELSGWQWRDAEWAPSITAAAARDALFSADSALEHLDDHLPRGTVDFLRDWVDLPVIGQLRTEWQLLKDYRASWASTPYPPILFTVDCVVRCQDHALLIRRGHSPGKGLLAVPGGFMEAHESAREAALRELEEETHLDLPTTTLRASLKSTALFDRPGRSGRGRMLTNVHHFDLGNRPLPFVRAGDDAAAVEWVPISELPELEGQFTDDHFQMLDHFVELDLLPLPAVIGN
ncbi:NUDIX domain-containing protein [Variovorax sp. GT1P44]|uniref:NUDIX domain-containing protein n=1 Tax=Variovorax sp. GT1P44 TaxID=3443742 RepID=UPI003F4658A6